jgi:(p)ppGpp synthase/HD superfamily hydrolase
LQIFLNLRAMRMVTAGRISLVTMKELSAVLAECAARTEIARAGVEEARKKQEAATAKQEAATAKQEELTAMLRERWAASDARWEEERVVMREQQEESARKTDAILAELREHRDERRALIEAIFRLIDRLDRQQPPPPPDLRSV